MLSKKRSAVNTSMKRAFYGKQELLVASAFAWVLCFTRFVCSNTPFLACKALSRRKDEEPDCGITANKIKKYGCERFPRMEQILKMRRGEDGYNEDYDCFMRVFMPHVVGVREWTTSMNKGGKISKIATATDEAFGLLVLDNNYDKWTAQEMGSTHKEEAKYTLARRKDGCKFASGWTEEGLDRYEYFYDRVLEDRKLDRDAEKRHEVSFETEFLDRYRERNIGVGPSKRKKQNEDEKPRRPRRRLPNDF